MNSRMPGQVPTSEEDGIEPLVSEYERAGKPLPPLAEWTWSPATAETSVGLEPEPLTSEYERDGEPLPPPAELL